MKNILVLGANGLVGHKVVFALHANDYNVIASARQKSALFDSIECSFVELDITNIKDVKRLLQNSKIDVVVNCAAYTAVDKAETEKELCMQINALAVKSIATACELFDIHLIHISSDYIFDGTKGPYSELDTPNPLSVYGRSKLAGDNGILSSMKRFSILRAVVVYGTHKDRENLNFVTWLIDQLKSKKSVRIIDDQYGTFTFAEDLVQVILNLLEKEKYGIFNVSGNEHMNRYDMSVQIAKLLTYDESLINNIKTIDLNQPAKRPMKSGFKIDKAIRELQFKPTSFDESINYIKKQLKES